MDIAMARKLMNVEGPAEGGISCADCINPSHPAVVAADYIGFIALGASSWILLMKLSSFKGPEADDKYFMGYREEKMISVFVNLFATVSYWARIVSHVNGNVGPAANVIAYKYVDYLLTCPLLTVDLLWSLNLPYKFTYGGFVLICILCAAMASLVPPPGRWLWFAAGLLLFIYTWYNIVVLVNMRLQQMTSKKVKKVRAYLKLGCFTYFMVWFGYPTLWVLYEAGIMDTVASHLLHTLFDIVAKSVYGFALLYFVLSGEKYEFIFLPLKPTLPKEEEISDDEDEAGGGIIIGSKKGRKEERDSKLRASWISTGSADTDGQGSRRNADYQNPLNGYHIPAQGNNFPTVAMHDSDIDNTAAEIASLNRQLDNIMAKQGSTRKSSV